MISSGFWATFHFPSNEFLYNCIFLQVFKEQVLRQNFQLEPRQLPKPILAYIDACVEITWLMCIQDPPMVITWATEGEVINTNYYKLFQTSGSIVKTCVWPVLLLHNRGPIVSKGYVLPQKRWDWNISTILPNVCIWFSIDTTSACFYCKRLYLLILYVYNWFSL